MFAACTHNLHVDAARKGGHRNAHQPLTERRHNRRSEAHLYRLIRLRDVIVTVQRAVRLYIKRELALPALVDPIPRR
jgi:hypothetical protein